MDPVEVRAIAADPEQYEPYGLAWNEVSELGRKRLFTLGQVKWGQQLSQQERVVAVCRAIYAWSHSEGGTMGGKILVFPLQGMVAALKEWVSKSRSYEEIV
jgi:hypothetical protein